ncbi:Smr/MutS family protein [Streptomyces mirabilis]|uniref:Smr/MutS family protein n=1 Tax=Streptomyces mirabilis TaxID=68239 RepID=UPI0037F42288
MSGRLASSAEASPAAQPPTRATRLLKTPSCITWPLPPSGLYPRDADDCLPPDRPGAQPRPRNSGRTHRNPGPAGWDRDREDDVRCDRTTSPRGPGVGRRPSASEAIALLTLDLHPIFRNNRDIDVALRQTLFKAAATGIDVVQIIPGKGTGQLKKRVLAVLAQKHIKKLYVRVETDATNAGRVLVYLR